MPPRLVALTTLLAIGACGRGEVAPLPDGAATGPLAGRWTFVEGGSCSGPDRRVSTFENDLWTYTAGRVSDAYADVRLSKVTDAGFVMAMTLRSVDAEGRLQRNEPLLIRFRSEGSGRRLIAERTSLNGSEWMALSDPSLTSRLNLERCT